MTRHRVRPSPSQEYPPRARGITLPEGAGSYAHGHEQASGGSLPVARWNELLAKLGFPLLRTSALADPDYDSIVRRLMQSVQHHVREEEGERLPQAEQQLGGDLDQLGMQVPAGLRHGKRCRAFTKTL
jgi:hypothetical protein